MRIGHRSSVGLALVCAGGASLLSTSLLAFDKCNIIPATCQAEVITSPVFPYTTWYCNPISGRTAATEGPDNSGRLSQTFRCAEYSVEFTTVPCGSAIPAPCNP